MKSNWVAALLGLSLVLPVTSSWALEIPELEKEFFPIEDAKIKKDLDTYASVLKALFADYKAIKTQATTAQKALAKVSSADASLQKLNKDLQEGYERYRNAYAMLKVASYEITVNQDLMAYLNSKDEFLRELGNALSIQSAAELGLEMLNHKHQPAKPKAKKKKRRTQDNGPWLREKVVVDGL